MKKISILSKLGIALGFVVVFFSCDYTAHDLPSNIEGQRYDIAAPIFHDTLSMSDLFVEGISLPFPGGSINHLPGNFVLDDKISIRHTVSIPDISLILSDFTTDSKMEVELLETVLNWSDNLPVGVTIQLMAWCDDQAGDKVYLIDEDEGNIPSGSSGVTRRFLLQKIDLDKLPNMGDLKISFGLKINNGTRIVVDNLRRASTDVAIGMRVKFNLNQ